MLKKRRALISVLTIFGLMLFAFASFLKQTQPDLLAELQTSSKHYYADSAGPASATAYLAEFKQRFIAVLTASFTNAISYRPAFIKRMDQDLKSTHKLSERTRPLWLVNRALLI